MSLLQMSFYGTIFILIVVIIRGIFIHRMPKTMFLILWEIALARLLLPVNFSVAFNIYPVIDRGIFTFDTFQNDIMDFTAEVMSNQSDYSEDKTLPTFPKREISFSLLQVLWAVGAAAAAVFFAMSYFRSQREFKNSLPVQNNFTSHWLSVHPLRRTIKIRQLAGLPAPLTYGIFHPVILMPKNTEWENERQIQYILFHEYIHIRRFDMVGKQIAAMTLCLHWFNPFVWILYILFNRDMELSCDERVIQHFGEKKRKDYAMTLICMEEKKSGLSPFGNYFSQNEIEGRIKAIMRTKKKTICAFILAAAIIITGTIAAFAMAPQSKNTDFKAVLQGKAPFYYVSGDKTESISIFEVPALFDPEDAYMKIWSFAVLDFDGDGSIEIVLSVYGAAGDMGGSLILHEKNGKIYGYAVSSKALTDLKADGTYHYSDPTGVMEGGICSITDFTKTGYHTDKITYGCGSYGEWDTFFVNHQPASQEEFLKAEKAQSEKEDAVWYDFDVETIEQNF